MKLLKYPLIVAALGLPLVLAACDEDIGTAAWCELMEAKDKADWSVNDAADYAKHCVIKAE